MTSQSMFQILKKGGCKWNCTYFLFVFSFTDVKRNKVCWPQQSQMVSPSYGSGSTHSPSGKFRWLRGGDGVTGQGMKPWDHLDGSASCGRPPSPPQWGPSPAPNCCMASSSHPAAAAHPSASPACPLLLMPERRKQTGGQPETSTRAETQTTLQPYLLQLLLFLLFTFWITAVRSVFLVLFLLFLLLFHHLISVHLGNYIWVCKYKKSKRTM